MTTKDEALIELIEDLLEQIERVDDHGPRKKLVQRGIAAITAIKQAITPETGNAATPEASAITAGNGQQAQEPVYWECRYKESNQYTVNYGQWYPWERLTPRNGLETVENRVAEIQHYIDRGYSYELRALFTHPAPKQAEPAITAHEQRCADVATAMFRNREGIQEIKAAITEPVVKESLTVPAGYKLVPVEPTQEMLDAVVTTVDDHLLGPDAEKQYREDWAAMLAAAPTPPETK